MSANTLLLIDLSGLAHMIWRTSGNEPDPSFVSNQLVSRIRALAAAHPHAAICCDSGKSFRADIDPSYKAQRDTENRAPLRHQMDVACETLAKDGFPIWRVPGFEADDLIASATKQALDIDGASVLIASSDKDLLALVSDRVSVKSFVTGTIATPEEVKAKFGVTPQQMPDLLALMGDSSDNIKGAEKIGKVIGAKLLNDHGSLAALYEKMAHGVVPGVTPAMRTNLMAFKERWPTVAQLVALRTDVPEGDGFTFAEIATERSAPPMTEDEPANSAQDMEEALPTATEMWQRTTTPIAAMPPDKPMLTVTREGLDEARDKAIKAAMLPKPGDVVPYREPAAPVVVDFSQQLEPRNIDEAKKLAQMLFDSRLFGAYGTPQAVLAVILSGRELGMGAMKSLKTHHIMNGRAVESADLIAAQVLRSGKAVYFKPVYRDHTKATFKTLRVGDDEQPFELTYTIEDGQRAWDKDERAWKNSGWTKNPADMCVARAKTKLARLVYPDVVAGLYAPEEME